MRGRTNVMQRKEPTVNGVVKTYTVLNGENITKGDFVDCYFQENEQNVLGSTSSFEMMKSIQIATNKYIYVKNHLEIKLIDVSSVYNELDSVPGIDFDVLPNGDIIVLKDTSPRTIALYSIENNLFVLKQIVTISYTQTTLSKLCVLSNGKILVSVYAQVSVPSQSYHLYIDVFNVANGVIDTTPEEYDVSIGSRNQSKPEMLFAAENNVFVEYYQNTASRTAYIANYFQYTGNGISNLGNINCGDSAYWGNVKLMMNPLSRYFVGASSSARSVTIGSLDNTHTKISEIDANNYVRNDLGRDSVGGSVVCLNENLILVVCTAQGSDDTKWNMSMFVLEYSNGEYVPSNILNFEVEQSIATSYQYSYGYGFINSNGDIFYFWDGLGNPSTKVGTNLLKINYSNHILSRGEMSRFVTAYRGGRTLGFAKTGGIAGDTIQVYTPQTVS